MAYKDSSEIATDKNYALGEYSFRIERSSGTSPNYDKIEAICTKAGKNARKSIQIPSSTQLNGWYVEANDTTADVYVRLKSPPVYTGNIQKPIPSASNGTLRVRLDAPTEIWYKIDYTAPYLTMVIHRSGSSGQYWDTTIIAASPDPGAVLTEMIGSGTIYTYNLNSTFTANGNTVYYAEAGYAGGIEHIASPQAIGDSPYVPGVAWNMIYGEYEDEKDVLVGRFVIELKDAGGVGPGSDWNDPGDYDDEWEPGDPTYTLNVEIDGALSGRHNDPLNDTSYSYIPAGKSTVKDYGCGGDGGNGGGGGGGASSIVVYKFATNKANSKEIVCKPKRHGYGSGGGKGGKGGDGCILIYY